MPSGYCPKCHKRVSVSKTGKLRPHNVGFTRRKCPGSGMLATKKKNPRGKHLPQATAKEQRMYEHILAEARKSGRYKGREKEVVARTVRAMQSKGNPKQGEGKGKKALRKTGRAIKGAARSLLSAGADILGAGAEALNPRRGSRSSQTYDSYYVGFRAGKNGRILSKDDLASYKRNFHPAEYRDFLRGLRDGKKERERQSNPTYKESASEQTKAADAAAELLKRRAAAKRGVKFYRRMLTIKHVAEEFFADPKLVAKLIRKKGRRNPSPDAIRKDFAGRLGKGQDLFFPEGTPQGLAKLGKLVSITTEEGTLKPTNGTAWLCADTNGRLHIGSTANKPLWSGGAHSFGSVKQVEYEESKPHLGFPNPIVFYHRLGEENGVKPKLYADGKGGLKFRGGAYRITRNGIEN